MDGHCVSKNREILGVGNGVALKVDRLIHVHPTAVWTDGDGSAISNDGLNIRDGDESCWVYRRCRPASSRGGGKTGGAAEYPNNGECLLAADQDI